MKAIGLSVLLLILGGFALVARPAGHREHAAGALLRGQGRHAEALAALTAASAATGDRAGADLLLELALAALGAGELRIAEIAAEKAAVRGGPATFAFRDFILGCVSLVRSDRAGAEALLPDADPTAFERAIDAAARARHHWQHAVVRVGEAEGVDWPQARRNAERAARALEDLEAMRRKAEADRERQKERTSAEQPGPQPGAREAIEQDVAAQADPTAPPADLVERVLARLRETEREKRALRAARRAARTAAVAGRDW